MEEAKKELMEWSGKLSLISAGDGQQNYIGASYKKQGP